MADASSARTRVLLVMEEVQSGGAEISCFSLSRALARYCEVHLALSRASLDNPVLAKLHESLLSTGVEAHCCETPLFAGTLANLHRALRSNSARELANLIQKLRPDVVLVNLPTVERGQAILDAAELCQPSPPVWGFLHLSQPPTVIGAKLGWLRDPLVPRLVRRFARLLAVSEAGAREVADRYGIQKPGVLNPPTEVFNPLDPGQRTRRRGEEGFPNAFLLGMVGRLDIHHKRQDVGLRVLRQLLHDRPDLHLVIAGDGPDRKALERMADRLGIASCVTFLGWRDDIHRIMPLLDLVLMPSRYEGLPQTAVQAVTAHVPVLGYAVGGLPELLPADFMVPPGDENGLAVLVAGVVQGLRKWPAAEVARRARERCDPDSAAKRLLEYIAASAAPGSLGLAFESAN